MRASRHRVAPSAARTGSSRWRADARTSSTFARFTHAMTGRAARCPAATRRTRGRCPATNGWTPPAPASSSRTGSTRIRLCCLEPSRDDRQGRAKRARHRPCASRRDQHEEPVSRRSIDARARRHDRLHRDRHPASIEKPVNVPRNPGGATPTIVNGLPVEANAATDDAWCRRRTGRATAGARSR